MLQLGGQNKMWWREKIIISKKNDLTLLEKILSFLTSHFSGISRVFQIWLLKALNTFLNYDAFQWDIAHAKPDFDYKPHVNCADYNTASHTFCQKANPCGKADEMQRLWYNDVKAQLRGNKPHMVLTMCHKDGAWSDDLNTKPDFDTSVSLKNKYLYI